MVKFYLLPVARGKRLGARIFDFVEERAKDAGYTSLYLETVPLFARAIEMYKERGFTFLKRTIANTGHSAPNVFMTKQLCV
ncbi:GNAT family N-acetyltransferase [uncultured Bacteroides sp.]|uniref:GNAT family N-acetyltransferase n=1 Tax=uncultured Bacteroides sp. TaxID=162156 RepID=UPI00262B3349|nr:GNAT family N-acetyltransferase [uncultured Bacteroides sp.]